MNKKSLVLGSLTMIILILVIFGAITMIVFYSWKFMDKQSDREICKLSLLAATKTKAIGAGDPVFRVDCKRHRLEIKYKDVKGDGKVDEEKVFRILQKELYECYTMIPELLWNKERPFSSLGPDPWTEWQYRNNICLICSLIEFEDKVTSYAENGKIEGFNEWLYKTPVPGLQQNFFELATGTKKGDELESMVKMVDEEAPIDPEKTYAIVVRWEAEGIFKSNLEATISLICHFQDKATDSWYCSSKHPVLAFMPIEDLGSSLPYVEKDENKLVDGISWVVTDKFCSVIWN